MKQPANTLQSERLKEIGCSLGIVLFFLAGTFGGFLLGVQSKESTHEDYIERINNVETKLELCLINLSVTRKVMNSNRIIDDFFEKDNCLKPKKENQK